MDLINEQSTVLIIYEDQQNLEKYLSNLKVKPCDVVTKLPGEVLNFQPSSKFSVILSGVVSPQSIQHDVSLLSAIIKLAKPDAAVVIHQVVKQSEISHSHLLSQLKLSGFTKISEPQPVTLSDDQKKTIQQKLNIDNIDLIEVKCYKPSFEVGSSAKLSLKPKANPTAVWKLDDDDEDESINPDELLDEDDLVRPDAAGLRVCSTTGKRKACKDCSCGLAEELATEKQSSAPAPKSSCGSCYLGDAFRCATCPYLGMPAFKPGEKVMLSDQQLAADS